MIQWGTMDWLERKQILLELIPNNASRKSWVHGYYCNVRAITNIGHVYGVEMEENVQFGSDILHRR